MAARPTPAAATAAPLDFDSIIKTATRREGIMRLCLAGDVMAELEELEAELERVEEAAKERTRGQAPSLVGSAVDPEVQRVQEQLEAVKERMRAAEVPFRFQALGDTAWSELLAAHPPKEKGNLFDPETFAPAAIAACSVSPKMTVEQVKQLYELTNRGQQNDLWNKVWEINTEAVGIPFSLRGSGILDSLTGGK